MSYAISFGSSFRRTIFFWFFFFAAKWRWRDGLAESTASGRIGAERRKIYLDYSVPRAAETLLSLYSPLFARPSRDCVFCFVSFVFFFSLTKTRSPSPVSIKFFNLRRSHPISPPPPPHSPSRLALPDLVRLLRLCWMLNAGIKNNARVFHSGGLINSSLTNHHWWSLLKGERRSSHSSWRRTFLIYFFCLLWLFISSTLTQSQRTSSASDLIAVVHFLKISICCRSVRIID